MGLGAIFRKSNQKIWGWTLIAIGLVLILVGLLLGWAIVPALVAEKVDDSIIPATNAEGLAEYSEPSVAPLYEEYHLFNLTNAEAWLSGAAKPYVEDHGLYTLELNQTKLNTTAGMDGCTITFFNNRTYEFAPSMSNASLNDTIYGLNPVLLGASVLFNGLVPAVQATILPGVLQTIMGKLAGVSLPPTGAALTPEMLAGQLATLNLTRLLSASASFGVTPNLIQVLATLPADQAQAITSQLGVSLPAGFVLEPAAFVRDYPGKNLTVTINGTESVVQFPSGQAIWPDFAGFTQAEGVLFVDYLNGTDVSVPVLGPVQLSTLLVIIMEGLGGEGMADQFVLMALNDTERMATLSTILSMAYGAINITTAPCQGAAAAGCEPYVTQLSIDSVDNFSKMWMLTVLNDYYTSWTQLAVGLISALNGGLVIKGTASDWIYGFESMPGMAIPGIISPGPEPENRTMFTGKCNMMDIGSWMALGGRTYVDPKLYPYSCPEALSDPEAAMICDALHIEGNDGAQFPRADKIVWKDDDPRSDMYKVWVTDINRFLPLVNSKNDVTLEGIKLDHFIIPMDAFSASAYNNSELYGITCSGLLEGPQMLESPSPAIPDMKNSILAISRPHFLFGDPNCTTDLVDGLHPDPELHDISLDIEPYTGATMNARKRLQASLLPKKYLIGDVNTPSRYTNMTNATVLIWHGLFNQVAYAPIPYFYVTQRSTITPSLADDFVSELYGPLKTTNSIMIALPILGGLITVFGVVLLYRYHRWIRSQASGMESEPVAAGPGVVYEQAEVSEAGKGDHKAKW